MTREIFFFKNHTDLTVHNICIIKIRYAHKVSNVRFFSLNIFALSKAAMVGKM